MGLPFCDIGIIGLPGRPAAGTTGDVAQYADQFEMGVGEAFGPRRAACIADISFQSIDEGSRFLRREAGPNGHPEVRHGLVKLRPMLRHKRHRGAVGLARQGECGRHAGSILRLDRQWFRRKSLEAGEATRPDMAPFDLKRVRETKTCVDEIDHSNPLGRVGQDLSIDVDRNRGLPDIGLAPRAVDQARQFLRFRSHYPCIQPFEVERCQVGRRGEAQKARPFDETALLCIGEFGPFPQTIDRLFRFVEMLFDIVDLFCHLAHFDVQAPVELSDEYRIVRNLSRQVEHFLPEHCPAAGEAFAGIVQDLAIVAKEFCRHFPVEQRLLISIEQCDGVAGLDAVLHRSRVPPYQFARGASFTTKPPQFFSEHLAEHIPRPPACRCLAALRLGSVAPVRLTRLRLQRVKANCGGCRKKVRQGMVMSVAVG